MRLRNSVLLIGIFPVILAAGSTPWPQILSSIGVIPGVDSVVVAGEGSGEDPTWRKKVEGGMFLVLEGDSSLAASFGFQPSGVVFDLLSITDVHRPALPMVLEKPLRIRNHIVPEGAQIFARDHWSSAVVVAGLKVGRGGVLWIIASPGEHGYERFPYIPQALADLGWKPAVRSTRTWAFFDYSYRTRVDLDYFAARWHSAGISALHVSAWHFYDRDPGRDAYLSHLLQACHREGILVYAWLELPHVSEKFWNDHPQWREKTALLQDAALDWRKLMNLADPNCARAVRNGVSDLIRRFDWDGVNLAELYYESLEGPDNPSRFTPMNGNIRSRFRAENGFDPADLWTTRKDQSSLRKFLDFRSGLARQMQENWLVEIEKTRDVHPDLDIVLTHVDDRMDKGMTDAIGADSTRALSLLGTHAFTFMVEDPATLWNLGPSRYPEIAKRYPASKKLAIDINVVDRYQDVYPTKQQTGIELFQLLHLASENFPRVALYFENSILAPDLPLLSAAASVVTLFEHNGESLLVDSPAGFVTAWNRPALVDDIPWAALDGQWITIPAGKHTVKAGPEMGGPHLTYFNGNLTSASSANKLITIAYSSSSRALATLDCEAVRVEIDGKASDLRQNGATLLLPSGIRKATIACK